MSYRKIHGFQPLLVRVFFSQITSNTGEVNTSVILTGTISNAESDLRAVSVKAFRHLSGRTWHHINPEVISLIQSKGYHSQAPVLRKELIMYQVKILSLKQHVGMRLSLKERNSISIRKLVRQWQESQVSAFYLC